MVGRKYVRLYAPACTARLYPFTRGLTQNSSQVDLDRPDHAAFPAFFGAAFQECVLEAGQVLYIPPGWWHYVRAVSVSMSVSYWWS